MNNDWAVGVDWAYFIPLWLYGDYWVLVNMASHLYKRNLCTLTRSLCTIQRETSVREKVYGIWRIALN